MMNFYVVKDPNEKLQVVGARGFIPKGAICEAPKNTDGSYVRDGSIIDIVKGKAVVNQQRAGMMAITEQNERRAAADAELVKKRNREALLDGYKNFDNLSYDEKDALLKRLIKEVLGL